MNIKAIHAHSAHNVNCQSFEWYKLTAVSLNHMDIIIILFDLYTTGDALQHEAIWRCMIV